MKIRVIVIVNLFIRSVHTRELTTMTENTMTLNTTRVVVWATHVAPVLCTHFPLRHDIVCGVQSTTKRHGSLIHMYIQYHEFPQQAMEIDLGEPIASYK
jgi:hypothetical protein